MGAKAVDNAVGAAEGGCEVRVERAGLYSHVDLVSVVTSSCCPDCPNTLGAGKGGEVGGVVISGADVARVSISSAVSTVDGGRRSSSSRHRLFCSSSLAG